MTSERRFIKTTSTQVIHFCTSGELNGNVLCYLVRKMRVILSVAFALALIGASSTSTLKSTSPVLTISEQKWQVVAEYEKKVSTAVKLANTKFEEAKPLLNEVSMEAYRGFYVAKAALAVVPDYIFNDESKHSSYTEEDLVLDRRRLVASYDNQVKYTRQAKMLADKLVDDGDLFRKSSYAEIKSIYADVWSFYQHRQHSS